MTFGWLRCRLHTTTAAAATVDAAGTAGDQADLLDRAVARRQLAAVGAALAYDTLGCGEKPAE